MKKLIETLKLIVKIICYPFFSFYFKLFPLNIEVERIYDTVDALGKGRKSVIRFGDGEFKIISGGSIYFQEYDLELSKKLSEILFFEDPNLKICLSDVFYNLYSQTLYARIFWIFNLFFKQSIYRKLPKKNWGNTFISRPYLFYKDKSNVAEYFQRLQSLWEGRNIVFVEGEQTRNGVGNDLYGNAKAIARIICPSKNAYRCYKRIEEFITNNIQRDFLLLFSLGPAAKVIAFDLYKTGYQVFDIGHLDSEYEWFRMGAKKRIEISGKHSAEVAGSDIGVCNDADYKKQIMTVIEEGLYEI